MYSPCHQHPNQDRDSKVQPDLKSRYFALPGILPQPQLSAIIDEMPILFAYNDE